AERLPVGKLAQLRVRGHARCRAGQLTPPARRRRQSGADPQFHKRADLPPNELLRVNPSRRYLLISPCRDEAQYLRRTLDRVAAQAVHPAAWVIVDDGSTDETPTILEEYAGRLPYLRVVRRTDRGRREVGPGVIAAFYAGLKSVRLEDFDYLCKLDMDLDLP